MELICRTGDSLEKHLIILLRYIRKMLLPQIKGLLPKHNASVSVCVLGCVSQCHFFVSDKILLLFYPHFFLNRAEMVA